MPQTLENWLGLVKSCVYYARQTCDIYQVLPYSVAFKALVEIHWIRQYLVDVVLFGIKDLYTFEKTVKLESNLFVGPVNIF